MYRELSPIPGPGTLQPIRSNGTQPQMHISPKVGHMSFYLYNFFFLLCAVYVACSKQPVFIVYALIFFVSTLHEKNLKVCSRWSQIHFIIEMKR